MKKYFFITCTLIVLVIFSNWYIEDEQYINIDAPNNWPKPVYLLQNNRISLDHFNLGRVLFYDPILSEDNTIACASCHSQYQAFAHSDHKLSHGINDLIGKRNAPSIQNMAWNKLFMWDGAVHHLDVLSIAPISNPIEMKENMSNVVYKLNQSKLYKKLFRKIYRDTIINSSRVLKSLAQFLVALNSFDSKYDQVMRKEKGIAFSENEKKGYQLFKKNCVSCHKEPLFTSNEFESNGLELDEKLNDLGRFQVTNITKDKYRFKVPTLRNIEVTYPYMHDGRYDNLQMVLFHYSTYNEKLPYISKKLIKNKIELNEQNKRDLIAFLLTLTDEKFLRNKMFSYPFDVIKENK